MKAGIPAGLLMLLHAACAGAQEKDWTLTAGLKLWHSSYQSGLPDVNATVRDENVIQIWSAAKTAPIGSLEFRRRQWYASISRFAQRTYQFAEILEGGGRFSTRIKRAEWHLTAGWFFVPQVAATVGYTQIVLEHAITTLDYQPGDQVTYDAFPIGLMWNVPLTGRWSLYGNAAIGRANAVYPRRGTSPGAYSAGETGLVYGFNKRVAGTFGYRYEMVNGNINSGHTQRETTSGLLAGLNYTF